jgi:hypothetical protein
LQQGLLRGRGVHGCARSGEGEPAFDLAPHQAIAVAARQQAIPLRRCRLPGLRARQRQQIFALDRIAFVELRQQRADLRLLPGESGRRKQRHLQRKLQLDGDSLAHELLDAGEGLLRHPSFKIRARGDERMPCRGCVPGGRGTLRERLRNLVPLAECHQRGDAQLLQDRLRTRLRCIEQRMDRCEITARRPGQSRQNPPAQTVHPRRMQELDQQRPAARRREAPLGNQPLQRTIRQPRRQHQQREQTGRNESGDFAEGHAAGQ